VIRAGVCVLGGGPAGSAIALRLAQLGHSVAVLEKARFPRPHVGESLAPDILGILDALGIRGTVERQDFLRPDAAIIRWPAETAVRTTAGAPGFQVDRAYFDLLLLREAAAAGAIVVQPFECLAVERIEGGGWRVSGRAESVEARYLVDATGRRGRLGRRKQRISESLFALYAYWREARPTGPETRVEAGESEWYWGAPLPDGTFNATVFLDPSRCGTGREQLYERLLRNSGLLKGCLDGRRIGAVRCCDAASYRDEDPIQDNVLKIGEASFSIDPLSSQGVRSAMGSALHGALVLHTMLVRPESAGAAAAFYRARQQEAVRQHREWAGRYYAEAAQRFDTPFWRSRGLFEESPRAAAWTTPAPVAGSVTVHPHDWLRLAPETRIVDMPRVEGEFIVEGSAIEHPGLARPLAYLDGIDVAALLAEFDRPRQAREIAARMPGAKAQRVLAELCRLGVLRLSDAPSCMLSGENIA
jgi:flavin-dependent dehydrogenase